MRILAREGHNCIFRFFGTSSQTSFLIHLGDTSPPCDLVGLSFTVPPHPMLLPWGYFMKDGRSSVSPGRAKPAGAAPGAPCTILPTVCRDPLCVMSLGGAEMGRRSRSSHVGVGTTLDFLLMKASQFPL